MEERQRERERRDTGFGSLAIEILKLATRHSSEAEMQINKYLMLHKSKLLLAPDS